MFEKDGGKGDKVIICLLSVKQVFMDARYNCVTQDKRSNANFSFQRERVLKKRMKEKKRAKQKMATAEHKVRVVTAFRGIKDNDLELQVGDEVTVLRKVKGHICLGSDIVLLVA